MVDGFKRLAAARLLGWPSLSTRLLAGDERRVKAAIYGLNCTGKRTQSWEEAWIVQALVREDGLTQPEAAELLGRHKSWVCRRLALVEKLAEEVKAELRLGLVTPTAARALVRLPAGNQAEVLAAQRREGLTTDELAGVVDLLLATKGREQQEYVLHQPRQALAQAQREGGWSRDPRLEPRGQPGRPPSAHLVGESGPHGELAGAAWPGRPERGRAPPAAAGVCAAGPRQRQRGRPDQGLIWEKSKTMTEQQRNTILSRWRAGASQRQIARDLGLSRNTVQRVLAGDRQTACRRGRRPAAPAAGAGRLCDRAAGTAGPLPGPDRRAAAGGTARSVALPAATRPCGGACRNCGRGVPPGRSNASRPAPACRRKWITRPMTSTSRDEGRRRVHLFSYVLGYSRRQYLRFVEAQDFDTTLREHVRAFDVLGRRGGHLPVRQLQGRGAPATTTTCPSTTNVSWPSPPTTASGRVACRPHRPQTKGKVERPFAYVETNLLNGRTFRTLAHLNEVTPCGWPRSPTCACMPDQADAPGVVRAGTAAPGAVAGSGLRDRSRLLPRGQRRRLPRLPAESLLGAVAAHRPDAAGARHRDRTDRLRSAPRGVRPPCVVPALRERPVSSRQGPSARGRPAQTPGPVAGTLRANWARWPCASWKACWPANATARTKPSGCWHSWPRIAGPTCWPRWSGPCVTAPTPMRPSNASWPPRPSPRVPWKRWPRKQRADWRALLGDEPVAPRPTSDYPSLGAEDPTDAASSPVTEPTAQPAEPGQEPSAGSGPA